MKNSLTLFVLLCFFSSISIAQTKMIAHKSHSGSAVTFKHSLELGGFNNTNSNFGVAPTRIIKNAQLDSVIFLNDSTAVMVTSDYCTDSYSNDTSLWKAGKDTVYNHPLFSKKNSLKAIKKTLDRRYNFSTPADSTIFVGYGQSQSQSQIQSQSQTQSQSQSQSQSQIQIQKKNQNQGLLPKKVDKQNNNQQSSGKQMHKASSVPFVSLFFIIAFISLLVAGGQYLLKNRLGE